MIGGHCSPSVPPPTSPNLVTRSLNLPRTSTMASPGGPPAASPNLASRSLNLPRSGSLKGPSSPTFASRPLHSTRSPSMTGFSSPPKTPRPASPILGRRSSLPVPRSPLPGNRSPVKPVSSPGSLSPYPAPSPSFSLGQNRYSGAASTSIGRNRPAKAATPTSSMSMPSAALPRLLGGGVARGAMSPSSNSNKQKDFRDKVPPQEHGVDVNFHDKPVAAIDVQDNNRECNEIHSMFARIDRDRDGFISHLEFVAAVQQDNSVASFVLPGVDNKSVLNDEDAFDAASAAFRTMAGGLDRISRMEFEAFFSQADPDALRALFNKIDRDKSGTISRLELMVAVHKDPAIAAFIRPESAEAGTLNDQDRFDAVSTIFDAMSNGKSRVEFADFETYLNNRPVVASQWKRSIFNNGHRPNICVLAIGQGFEHNPRLGAQLSQAGYDLRWLSDLPCPDSLVSLQGALQGLTAAIKDHCPDVLLCASKGGAYVVALWKTGSWTGPVLMINAHPQCQRLPKQTRVVLAHGGNDERYRRSRSDLESLIATGSPNSCFLYYSGSSGFLNGMQRSRVGDQHAMESLLSYDCLPRLLDSAVSDVSPDLCMMRSWTSQLSKHRVSAEQYLGYTCDKLRQRWVSRDKQGFDEQKLFELSRSSNEYASVAKLFKAAPRETPAYNGGQDPSAWQNAPILRIERVENGSQERGARAYYESLQRALEAQSINLEPGVHTRWAFHGTDAIASIVSNPVAGFQPLASGTRGASLWGSGTYFARDARYVADGGFCKPRADGTKQMLLCLLSTGMPCIGDAEQRGILPFRQGTHRYDSSVDSMSSPEIFIVHHPGAAYPAYVVTFV